MKQMSPKVLKCNGTVKEWKCQCMPLRTTTYKIMGTKSNVTMHVPLNVFNGWLIDSAQLKWHILLFKLDKLKIYN